jgi:hypothetical protein
VPSRGSMSDSARRHQSSLLIIISWKAICRSQPSFHRHMWHLQSNSITSSNTRRLTAPRIMVQLLDSRRPPGLVSMAMWVRFMRHIPIEGISAADLQSRLAISKKGLNTWLTRRMSVRDLKPTRTKPTKPRAYWPPFLRANATSAHLTSSP